MSKKLEGKIALITGGSAGIGLATAKEFVEEGAYVYITGRRRPELDAAVASIGSNITAIQGDVTKLADLDRIYAQIGRETGRLDIVFANAGGGPLVPLGAITEEHFDSVFNVNVKGLVFTAQKALPLMSDGGTIILTGSIVGIKGFLHSAFTRRQRRQYVALPARGPRTSKIATSESTSSVLARLTPRSSMRPSPILTT